MTRALIYTRVSSRSQANSGLGEEAQHAACMTEAARLSLPVAGSYYERAVEGDTPLADRPALLALIGELRRGDVVLVARRDRIGRDVIVIALIGREIERRGARIVSAAGEASELEGPSGALIRTILDAVSAYEKALIALRTRAALRALRARGKRAGALPYGFTASEDGTLTPEPTQQRALALALELRASGSSWRAIAARLNEEWYPTQKKGGRWSVSNVRSVVETAKRAGAGPVTLAAVAPA